MLEIKNLGLKFQTEDGEVEILKDINLKLENKKIYVLDRAQRKRKILAGQSHHGDIQGDFG